jgi:hypothetical protein
MTRANQVDPADFSVDGPCSAARRSFLAMMAALIGPSASAQDAAEDRDKSTPRLEPMRRLAKEVKVCEITDGKQGPPLALRPEPLLRYTNPTLGVVDGTLWGWGERGRPTAVMKLGFRGPARGQRHWAYRVNVLSAKQIEVTFGDGQTWSSRKPGLELSPLPDAPAPADSAARRLIQAKDIARRHSTSTESPNSGGRRQLRLLARPIDRYSDPAAGLLDGVLFSFVYTNNPSVLLVLEAWSEDKGERGWRYAFVRQGYGATALLDGKTVWSLSSDRPPADTGLFITRQMPASPAEQD